MSELGRDTQKLLREAVKALERNAQATEKMLAIAEREQIDFQGYTPSACPNCGIANPQVTQIDAGGSGPLDEFVLVGETHCCNKRLYAVPLTFATTNDINMVADLRKMMRGGNNV